MTDIEERSTSVIWKMIDICNSSDIHKFHKTKLHSGSKNVLPHYIFQGMKHGEEILARVSEMNRETK